MRERKRRSASVSCFFGIMNGPKIEVLQYFNNLFTISDKGNDYHARAARGYQLQVIVTFMILSLQLSIPFTLFMSKSSNW